MTAIVYVETESQKGILVGKRGAMVREIGTRARPEVEALVGHPVFLELTVKVRPKWRRDPSCSSGFGRLTADGVAGALTRTASAERTRAPVTRLPDVGRHSA